MCYEIFKASNWENSNAINILLIMGVRWPVVFKKIYIYNIMLLLNRAIKTEEKPIVDIFVSCLKKKKLKSTYIS